VGVRVNLPNLILVVLIAAAVESAFGGMVRRAGLRSGAWVGQRLFGPRAPEPTREVVVLCRDESSFGGVELRRDTTGILLAAPKLLPDDGPPVKLEGDLWVPADNVRAVQIVT
jgi:hypothetical protein